MEYSDAYDMANQPEAESGLLINPAVKAAVESQFAVTPAIPDIVQKKGVNHNYSDTFLHYVHVRTCTCTSYTIIYMQCSASAWYVSRHNIVCR